MFWRKKTFRQKIKAQTKKLTRHVSSGYLFHLINPKHWQRYYKNQRRELHELADGEESFRQFTTDSVELLKDLFIPNEKNDNKPRALRPKSLATYVIIALVIKFSVTGFLFTTYPTTAELSAIVSSKMIALANESRAAVGLSSLRANETLTTYAWLKGKDMLARDYFTHDTPEGQRPWEWIDRSAYDYVYAGENLAMDFVTAEVVHDAFMKSPSHRRNILNEKYQDIGVAVLQGELAGRETILLVNFFGTKRSDVVTGIVTTQTPPEDQGEEEQSSSETLAGVAVQDNSSPRTVQEDPRTPTPDPINEGLIVVSVNDKTSKTLVDFIIEYSNIFFIAFLIFMLISLALNIFINIRVQHSSVILQSIVVIALMAALLLVKFHFVEQVAPQLLIL